VVAELLDQVANQIQAGEPVDVEALLAAHPEHADRLRRLLPAAQVLAELEQSGKAAVPGPGDEAELEQRTLGDFRILREVGRGGMGVVYEAEQISLRRQVALKVLPFAGALDPKQLQRFKNEAQAAAQLRHPNIVPVYFVGSERGVHFYAMQFIEGRTLAELIDELRRRAGKPATAQPTGCGLEPPPAPTSPREREPAADTQPERALTTEVAGDDRAFCRTAARLAAQAAEALEHAHQLGIIHRDVKPANLMLETSSPSPPTPSPGGREAFWRPSPLGGRGVGGEGTHVWVTDFGLAQFQGDGRLTMSGDLLGTLRYMSPEQARAERGLVDQRSDVYALGVTLYELLTLEPAFPAAERARLLDQVLNEEPRRPRS
jgi:serine/threonine-protein kinase